MGYTIVHISTRLILGGSQENTVLSCIGQSRMGHRVHLAYGPIFGPEGSHKDTIERFNQRVRDGLEPGASEIGMHELPNMVREVHPWKDHFCFHHDLKRLMRDLDPDIVHTHSSKAGVLGRIVAWRWMKKRMKGKKHGGEGKRVGVVHTIHGPPFMPIEGTGLKPILIGAKNAMYTLAERMSAKHCHRIVSVADSMTEQFLARGIGNADQYSTVRSGMEVEGYLNAKEGEDRDSIREELGIEDGDFVIGTVARLAEHKGHDDVLDGIGDVLKERTDWKLLWVGDGWWADRLMDRVREMGIEDRVIHTGLVNHDRVPAMMRAMDVLVHPSYREGLPRTVPQALLCGVPVVASCADGTPEVCLDIREHKERGTGLLVGVGDPEGIRASVEWMFEHPKEREAIGACGRSMCVDMFSTQRMVDELEKVYEASLEG